jgi:dTDP-4-dehydrorhamnose 3,5-epimerase
MEHVSIEGVIITPLKQIFHPKGNIYHGLKKADPGFKDFGEAYFSSITPGAIKAWKRHFKMTLNLVVPVGEVKFVLVDGRESSATYKAMMEVILSTENYKRLTVPPGVWMGFQGQGKALNLLLNVADIMHDPDEQENIEQLPLDIVYHWS